MPPADLRCASQRVLLDVTKVKLPEDDVEQLVHGLAVMAPKIERREAARFIVVEVDSVVYTPTDYQPEGLAAAMIGWIAEEFDVPSPIRDIRFDKDANRYVFVM